MQETTFAPQAFTRYPLRAAYRPLSDTPIYDALEREWRREGRTLPRQAPSTGWEYADDRGEDRFRRA
ncbi:hypothetical protein [Streptomyces sp. NPDC002990]